MQKKLLAVATTTAVAGALLAPAAMAQSAVTISGVFKVGIDNYKISNPGPARAGLNTSETRITDNSSRIIFGITEDLGGGTAAIAQLDARVQLDDAGETNVASGNSWIGVRSTSLGTVSLGRHELHYGKQPDAIASKAGALMAAATSLMDHTYTWGTIANATRTPNVVRYDSPNLNGFALTVGYSTNPGGNEADLTTGARKGNAWNFNPSYTTRQFQIGGSVWRQKADGAGAGADQDSFSLYGYYQLGAFRIGAAVNDAQVETPGVGKIADRRNFTVPASWSAGPHNVYAHITRAGQDKSAPAAGLSTKASMVAVAYVYDVSKRTSVGLTYARIDNGTNARYNFFTNGGGLSSTNASPTAGEDPSLLALTLRHAF